MLHLLQIAEITKISAIFVKIFQPAKALEIFSLSADSAIYIRGKYFPEPLSIRQIPIYLAIMDAGLHCGKYDFIYYKTANNICIKLYAKNKKQ